MPCRLPGSRSAWNNSAIEWRKRRHRSDSRSLARRALRSAWYSVVCVRILVAAGTFEFPEFVAQKLRAVRDQREHPVALLTCGDDFFLRSRRQPKTQKLSWKVLRFMFCAVDFFG